MMSSATESLETLQTDTDLEAGFLAPRQQLHYLSNLALQYCCRWEDSLAAQGGWQNTQSVRDRWKSRTYRVP